MSLWVSSFQRNHYTVSICRYSGRTKVGKKFGSVSYKQWISEESKWPAGTFVEKLADGADDWKPCSGTEIKSYRAAFPVEEEGVTWQKYLQNEKKWNNENSCLCSMQPCSPRIMSLRDTIRYIRPCLPRGCSCQAASTLHSYGVSGNSETRPKQSQMLKGGWDKSPISSGCLWM